MKAFKTPYIAKDTQRHGGMLYTTKGDYSVVIKCINPVMQLSANPRGYKGFHKMYNNILKTIGEGYILQKQDVITKKHYKGEVSEDYLSNKYNKNFQGRPYNEVITYLTLTKVVKRGAFYKFDQKEFDAYQRNVGKVIDILDSNELSPHVLTEEACELLIKRMIAVNFNRDVISMGNISANKEHLEIGGHRVKSMSLVDVDEINLPNTIAPFKDHNDLGYQFPVDIMGFLLDTPDFETIIYNQVIEIPSQLSEINKLQRKKQRHGSMPDPANDASVQDIDALMADVAKNSQMLVYSHFNILVKGTGSEIDTATNYIESALFGSGIIPSGNAYNQLELFRTMLPGNATELKVYDKFLTTSDAAICFFFKERLQTDEDSPFKIYFSDRQGIPVGVDTNDAPVDTGRTNNRNKFVLGPSGSGKSFFMNHLIRQYFLYRMDIVLVDTGHSYSGICTYYKGKYITYSEKQPLTTNPFRIRKEEHNEEKREFIKSLIGLIWKGADGTLTQIEDTILANTVESYFSDYFAQKKPDPSVLCFNHFYDYSLVKIEAIIEEEGVTFALREYAFILKRFYKGGQFEEILNEEMDASLFEAPFIVFEIDSIKEHKVLFPIITVIIMDAFLQKMRHKKNRKALIIEEAWKAIASPIMASYILYLYKTVRKFWGEAVVVTQELDDILGNEIVKNSILSNSDTICLLDQSKFKDNYDEVAKLLSINDVERRKIFTINKLNNKYGRGKFKEVYIRRGSEGEVYGVEVSLYEYLTYTTERKEKEAVQLYLDRAKTFEEGLENFVNDLERSGKKLSEFFTWVNANQQAQLSA